MIIHKKGNFLPYTMDTTTMLLRAPGDQGLGEIAGGGLWSAFL
jgi:hypothetical protein